MGVHTGGAVITSVSPHPNLPPLGGKEPSSVGKSRAGPYCWKAVLRAPNALHSTPKAWYSGGNHTV